MLRHDLERGQRYRVVIAEHRDGDFGAGDEPLDENVAVEPERFVDRRREFTWVVHDRHAYRGALVGRLDDRLVAQELDERADVEQLALAKHGVVRCGETGLREEQLAHDLVHGERAGEHAGTDIREFEQLAHPLYRAVFAEATVQRDEDDIRFGRCEIGDEPLVACVDLDDVESD